MSNDFVPIVGFMIGSGVFDKAVVDTIVISVISRIFVVFFCV